MAALYLASQSPRRRELLDQIGVQYAVLSVDVPEVRGAEESPTAYVQRLAREKAHAGWQSICEQNLPALPVLGADTIGECDGHVLEKPKNEDDAVNMLSLMSGRPHRVLTAIAICLDGQVQSRLSITDVYFKSIPETLMRRYWQTGEPKDKAGAYGIQGKGAIFVDRLIGSYSGVVGLPLTETYELLSEYNIDFWQ